MGHIKKFNEHRSKEEDVTASDATHKLYGEIKIGDRIEWQGNYFSGIDRDGNFKSDNFQSGVNKVKRIFKEGAVIYMELDNRKQFRIKSLRNPNEDLGDWKKLN